MWGSLQKLAEQAKKAAEDLDQQLNESAGVQPTVVVVEPEGNHDDALNDAWDDDEEEDLKNGHHQEIIPEEDQEDVKAVAGGGGAEEAVEAEKAYEAESTENGWDAEDVEFSEVMSAPAGDEDPVKEVPPATQSDKTKEEVVEEQLVVSKESAPQKSSEQYEPTEMYIPEEVASVEQTIVSSAVGLLGNISQFAQHAMQEVASTDAEDAHQRAELETEQEGGPLAPEISPQLENQDPVVREAAEPIEDVPSSEARSDNAPEAKLVQVVPTAAIEPVVDESSDKGLHAIKPKEPLVVTTQSELPKNSQVHSLPLPSAPELLSSDEARRDSESAATGSENAQRVAEVRAECTKLMEPKMEELQQKLLQREEQLFSKTEQLTTMESMYESQKQELVQKVQSTKEEAKRRIQKAKERVDLVEQKLKVMTASQSSGAEDAQKQAEIVTALRAEGEKLARKQADMEAAVRAAKGESRELRAKLEDTEAAEQMGLSKIEALEAELTATRDDLTCARQGESQAGKLDSELRHVREESEKRANTILALEQEVKELKLTEKELTTDLAQTREGAAVESEQERQKLRKEHTDLVSDLEGKLRTTEREAAVREDALRHEVDELRKRWQDAVRRADALSVDVQSSTAPLLRQLESTNKQSRARAAGWAELETQLRAELEETVIDNEKLTKERNDLKAQVNRLERSEKENGKELLKAKSDLDHKTLALENLEKKLEKIESENEKKEAEYAEVERLANEGVSRVRSEMTMTAVDAEERHRIQLENLDKQLRDERERRSQLEKQVDGLIENATGLLVPSGGSQLESVPMTKEVKPKKLRKSEGQAEILAGALGGFGDSDDSDDEEEDENDVPISSGGGSIAALEQLSSRLKASKVELTTLRDRLAESEKSREDLVQNLAESQNAREKLPLFEAKVKTLTTENEELTLEVQGLREDILEVKEMYRTQLNILLEAQVESPSNGSHLVAEETGNPSS